MAGLKTLFGGAPTPGPSVTTPQPRAPAVLPTENSDAIRDRLRRKRSDLSARQGRASTVLTRGGKPEFQNEQLG